jgi:hypothetical protein
VFGHIYQARGTKFKRWDHVEQVFEDVRLDGRGLMSAIGIAVVFVGKKETNGIGYPSKRCRCCWTTQFGEQADDSR